MNFANTAITKLKSLCKFQCPFNRFAVQSSVFQPRLDPSPDLERLAALTPEEFADNFRDTPILRTGLAAFLRNVLLAMGNSGAQRFRKTLERFVRLPPSPLEKAESLEQLRALEAGIPITAFLAREKTVAIDTAADLRRARMMIHG